MDLVDQMDMPQWQQNQPHFTTSVADFIAFAFEKQPFREYLKQAFKKNFTRNDKNAEIS